MNNPTGTSIVMVDAAGEEVGRMLYDGFGGVLTSTMPITLTGALPDTPDAATGLVHLGGGRWYDPALGRPLQPNPAGGAVVVVATVHDGYCTGAKAACEPRGEQLSVGDIVRITIRDVDSERGRISLGWV